MSYSNEPTSAKAGPVSAGERLASLDTLRGVAVLGILVINIYAFAMPLAAYNNPLVMGGTEVLNIGTWFVTHIFFDQKFMSIFSMLFGAGMILIAIAIVILPITLLINFGSFFYIENLQEQVAEIQQIESSGEAIDETQQKKLDEWGEMRPFFTPSEADIQK